jgi:hypothetical protein
MATVSGGDKFEAALAAIAKKLESARSVKVGFLAGSTSDDDISLPMIAAVQEFGAPAAGIPPRPFFRNMVAEKSPGWPDTIVEVLKANDYDAAKTLKGVGQIVKGQLQLSIHETNSPPLAQSTIDARLRRGSKASSSKPAATTIGKPLVDTGVMLASVDYEVE